MFDSMSIISASAQNYTQDIANLAKIQAEMNTKSMLVNKIADDIQNQPDSVKEAAKLVGKERLTVTAAETVINKVEEGEIIAKNEDNLLTENALTHGAVLDFPPPEGSTVSYHI